MPVCVSQVKRKRQRQRQRDGPRHRGGETQTLWRAWDSVGAVGAAFLEESSTIERRELRLHHPKNEEVNQNHPQGTMVKATLTRRRCAIDLL